jgi:hypothetical protein
MDKDREVEDSELSAIIGSELRQAQNYDTEQLNGRRTLAIEYMRGEMNDTPARPNGSQQTVRTFADAHAWMLPGVIRVFMASHAMVKYEKVKPEDDQWSRDASDYTNYTFFRESDGYKVLYNATYDALQMGDGLVCSYWEPERIETKLFRDKTELEIAALIQEEGWQPTGVVRPGKPRVEPMQDPMTGEVVEMEVPTLTVKLGKKERTGKICDIACKPDNLYLNSSAIEIETARFVAYRHDDKTRSDLYEMAKDYGWSREAIEELPKASPRGTDTETEAARYGERGINYDSPVRSGDEIDLFECYMRADMDGDGIAELIQVWWAGDGGSGRLLGWEEWEGEIPFTHIPCYPVPHQSDSQSLFDRTHDLSRVQTVLIRQLLDNLYATNMPMREVEEGSVKNPDILVNPKFGGLIWKTRGSAPMQTHTVPFVADKALLGLQYFDEMLAKRTGVSKTTMALDPEALQGQTATANQNNKDAAYSQIELVARNMAEYGGWQKFFAKRLKLAILHRQIRAIPDPAGDNGFREVDSGRWDPNMAVAINVGLGTGSRDRDMSMLNLILNGQIDMADRLGAVGFGAKAIEFIPKIRETAVKLAESSGIRNPEEYYPEITKDEMAAMQQQAAQPKPDPKLEMDMAKQQSDQQMQQQKLQFDAMKAEQELVLKREQLAAEMQLKREQLAAELELKREQLTAELALQRELGMVNAMSKASVSTSAVRPGGEPG